MHGAAVGADRIEGNAIVAQNGFGEGGACPFGFARTDVLVLHVGKGLDVAVSAHGDLEHGAIKRCEMAHIFLFRVELADAIVAVRRRVSVGKSNLSVTARNCENV